MSDDYARELGVITDAKITLDRGCIMCCWLTFRFSGSGQGFGGNALDEFNKAKDRREGTAAGADYIRSIMEMFKVERFRDIEGKYAYALRDEPMGTIIGIERPEVDGGAKFVIEEWRKEWGYTE